MIKTTTEKSKRIWKELKEKRWKNLNEPITKTPSNHNKI